MPEIQNNSLVKIVNKDTKKNIKYKPVIYTGLGSLGAIGGYFLPFDTTKNKEVQCYPHQYDYYEKTNEEIRARIKNKQKNTVNIAPMYKRLKSKINTPNYSLKILFAIIGAALGLYAGKKINNKIEAKKSE